MDTVTGEFALLPFLFLCLILASQTTPASPVELLDRHPEGPAVLLWPDGAPNAVGKEDSDRPQIVLYLPEAAKATGAGIVVCPGGGYGGLADDHEGRQIGEWLREQGIAAFILRYRHAPRYRHPAPLTDARRAIRLVRSRSDEWGVTRDRIGIWGFSAGGHLASTAATHFTGGDSGAADTIERESSRPDFLILCYPVISFTAPFTHVGSRDNLLGVNPDPRLAEELSNEKRVTPQTPPTFLFHTDADDGVPSENSVAFYLGLRQAGVPAELHIFEPGAHGVGLALADPTLGAWPLLLSRWFRTRGLLAAPAGKRGGKRGATSVEDDRTSDTPTVKGSK